MNFELINRLKEVTESNDQSLDLSYLNLKKIPSQVLKLKNITSIRLQGNLLTTFPIVLDKFKELEYLDLDFNNILSLPSKKSIGFKNLKNLYIQRNNIKEINNSILYLPKLEYLSISENPITNIPLEIFNKPFTSSLHKIRNYFKNLKSQGVDRLFETKLIIVGAGGAGKTTLMKKLIDPNYNVPRQEDTTKGIEVFSFSFKYAHDENIKIKTNIWDFGGQEIYHSTHQFFLTRRSLYVLVADNRKEDSDFDYWLNTISIFSNDSPTIIVLNEKENRRRFIDEKVIKAYFPNIKETLRVNFASNRGLNTINDTIKWYLSNLDHIGDPLPKKWVQIRNKLEKIKKDYISYEDYLKVCKSEGIISEEDASYISYYLHDLGVILHFQDDFLLRNLVILKPEWGTTAVYKVLDNNDIIENGGEFTLLDLDKIWRKTKIPRSKYPELLQLMKNFELCYEVGNNKVFIAPQILRISSPKYNLPNTECLSIKLSYEFMPKGIITRFIVQMSKLIKENLVWQHGVVLEEIREKYSIRKERTSTAKGSKITFADLKEIEIDETKYISTIAEITENLIKKEILVNVYGEDKDKLILDVLESLIDVNNTIRNLSYNILMPCNCVECSGSRSPHYFDHDFIIKAKQKGRDFLMCNLSFENVDIKSLLAWEFKIREKRLLKEKRLKIFVSYCHSDKQYKNRLTVHLSNLKHNSEIIIWDNEEILPGEEIEKNIRQQLQSSDFIIILVSADYLNSQWLTTEELDVALERNKRGLAQIFPIYVKPCTIEFSVFNKLKILPTNLRSVSSFENKEVVLKNIASLITKEVRKKIQSFY